MIKRILLPVCWKEGKNSKFCKHIDHDLPSLLYMAHGIYEHTCPGCNKKTLFTVPNRMKS